MRRLLSVIASACCLIVIIQTAHPTETGAWIKLFDGETLTGWRIYNGEAVTSGWVAEGGALFLQQPGVGTIITENQYDNFELRLEWKVPPGGDSGIMVRVREGDREAFHSGPEYQIVDDLKHQNGAYPKTSAAALYALVAPTNKSLKPQGQYNSARIILQGDHLEHWLNGKQVLAIDLGSKQWNTLVAASKFKQWESFGKMRTGHIALQDEGDVVWYRNIRIRPLSPR